ncbi:MAG TPA: cation diffusion facilitator family transporter [Miltoncostaeaceae bacterium]|nr:cation diffusion facilitator family transporter [Miltoncostaeaceae bacterium]
MDQGTPPRTGLTPAARTALVSVAAAVVLIAVKLSAGLASGSLALVSEAVHSGSDLVAAVLAFLALRVAGRPPDRSHPYGHGKAEHLSALLEGLLLVAVSGVIVWEAVGRLGDPAEITTGPWVWASLALVVVIDAARASASWIGARRHSSPALAAGALHFAGDLAGTLAVIVGLLFVEAGHPEADALAALAVAALVLVASGRLMLRNADILLDRAPAGATREAREAIAALGPGVTLRRLRVRQAAGRHFADVVVAVPPGSALGQAHAAADAVEEALERAVPGMDSVVHVEPGEGSVHERVLAAAQGVAGVREVHNVRVVTLDEGVEASLHLKLPAGTPLAEADAVAGAVRAAVTTALPGVRSVRTHLEPLEEVGRGRARAAGRLAAAVEAAVRAATGVAPGEVRVREVAGDLVAYVTLPLPGDTTLDEAHATAARARRAGRDAAEEVRDVFVETVASNPPPTGQY